VNPTAFNQFCRQVDPQWRVEASGDFITFWNSDGKQFPVKHPSLVKVLRRWLDRNEQIRNFIESHPEYDAAKGIWTYKEKIFREIFKKLFPDPEFGDVVTLAGSQTRGLMQTINKLVGATIGNPACTPGDPLLLDEASLKMFFEKEGISPTKENLDEAFRKICNFCAEYNASAQGWTTTDSKCIEVVQHLTALAKWLEAEFANYRGVKMRVSVARGAGDYPRIPWVAVLPPDQEVNKGVYVALCFGREGNGLVAGFAESATAPVGLQTIDRRSTVPFRIDVDGSTSKTKYNNVFENPMEVDRNAFKADILSDHIRKSLDRCIDFLKLKPSQIFSSQSYLNSLKQLRTADSFQGAVWGTFREVAFGQAICDPNRKLRDRKNEAGTASGSLAYGTP
jgi:hypothetical protein